MLNGFGSSYDDNIISFTSHITGINILPIFFVFRLTLHIYGSITSAKTTVKFQSIVFASDSNSNSNQPTDERTNDPKPKQNKFLQEILMRLLSTKISITMERRYPD